MRALKIEAPTLLFVLILACVAVPRIAAGQAAAVPDDKRPRAGMMSADEAVILTYDVGDLILDVPDYPYPGSAGAASPFGSPNNAGMGGMGGMGGVMGGVMGGGMGGMMGGGAMPGGDGAESEGGGVPSDRNPLPGSTKITMEDLKRVLTTVIAPNTWTDSGGEEGELQCLGTSLVVRQTAVVHKQIEDLLEQLRKGSGKQRTVAVDARWLLLNSDELEKLIPAGENGQPHVDRQILGEFTRRPTSIRGRTNCFTGQLVYLVSGTRRNVVTSFIPVVGSLERPQTGQYAALPGGAYVLPAQMGQSSQAVGYQPVIETPNLGVLLQIRPTLIPNDDRAIVDLRSTLTVLGKSASESGESVQPQQDLLVPKVDRVAIETQELATTLSVPLGEPVLAGGLTYIGPSADAMRQEADANRAQPLTEAPQLYLILELR